MTKLLLFEKVHLEQPLVMSDSLFKCSEGAQVTAFAVQGLPLTGTQLIFAGF
jgi:hypothetical protein